MKIERYDYLGTSLIIPIAESYHDCLELIRSDRFRQLGKKENGIAIVFKSIWQTIFPTHSHGLPVLFWLRLSQYKGWLWLFCRWMYAVISRNALVDIPIRTKIGYGFYIGHGMGMVINGGTIIGNNVNLSHFVSIGTNNNTPSIIGDNVYVGPNVSIVEDVRIGKNATIGAGAVVTKDVPEKGTAVGVPAHIVNNKGNKPVNPYPFTAAIQD